MNMHKPMSFEELDALIDSVNEPFELTDAVPDSLLLEMKRNGKFERVMSRDGVRPVLKKRRVVSRLTGQRTK